MIKWLSAMAIAAVVLLAGCESSDVKKSGDEIDLSATPSGPRPTPAVGGGGETPNNAKVKIQAQ